MRTVQEETLTLEQIKSMVHGEAMEFHTPGTEVRSADVHFSCVCG